MSSNPFAAAYFESAILTASPVKLVHLAYEGALEAVAEARKHLKEKRIFERSKAITKAQLILTELQRTLDFEKGGEISARLAQLYKYMQGRLREANFKQMEEPLADVENLLETLGSAWKDIAAKDNPLAAAASATPASSALWTSTPEPAAPAPVETFAYRPFESSTPSAAEPPGYSWGASSYRWADSAAASASSANSAPASFSAPATFPWMTKAEPAEATPVEKLTAPETPAYSWANSSYSYRQTETATASAAPVTSAPASFAQASFAQVGSAWTSTPEPAAPAPAETFTYTPSGTSPYTSSETSTYSWTGSSRYGQAEQAYAHADYTL